MSTIKYELDPTSKLHLTRFTKFLGTRWLENKMVSSRDEDILESEYMEKVLEEARLIDWYVEWLNAGEPE